MTESMLSAEHAGLGGLTYFSSARMESTGPAERLRPDQFEALLAEIEEITDDAGSPDLQTFGPSNLYKEEALEEKFIQQEADFRPDLRIHNEDGHFSVLGYGYDSVCVWRVLPGNIAADRHWRGEINFDNSDPQNRHGSPRVSYQLFDDGSVTVLRVYPDSGSKKGMVVRGTLGEYEADVLIGQLRLARRQIVAKGAARAALDPTISD